MKTASPSFALVPALIGLALLAAPAAAQDAPQQRVRIGTWNIENFGGRREKREDADYERIGDFIKNDLGVDVLALQEVNGVQPLQRLTKAMGSNWSFLIGSSGKIGRTKTSRQIAVAFLYDTNKVELLHAHELNELPRKSSEGHWIFHRVPLVATFRHKSGGIDFRAVSVHFKAGRLNLKRSAKDSAKRQAEVTFLTKRLQDLLASEGEDQDLIVLGDYNSDPSYPAWKKMAEHFQLVEPVEKHQTIVYFEEQIDHAALSKGKGLAEELIPNSVRIRSELFKKLGKDEWKAKYSDHIPLVLELDASRDRDPEARFSAPSKHLVKPGQETPEPAQEEPKKPKKQVPGTRTWF